MAVKIITLPFRSFFRSCCLFPSPDLLQVKRSNFSNRRPDADMQQFHMRAFFCVREPFTIKFRKTHIHIHTYISALIGATCAEPTLA